MSRLQLALVAVTGTGGYIRPYASQLSSRLILDQSGLSIVLVCVYRPRESSQPPLQAYLQRLENVQAPDTVCKLTSGAVYDLTSVLN